MGWLPELKHNQYYYSYIYINNYIFIFVCIFGTANSSYFTQRSKDPDE
jgi:hypothetical protein